MNDSSYLPLDHSLFDRDQLAIITDIKYLLDNIGQVTKIFSGFIGVQLLHEPVRFDFVRWANSAFGSFENKYGIIVTPKPKDVVVLGFDVQNRPYVRGMVWYEQTVKGLNDLVGRPNELTDTRLLMIPGEIRIRGDKGNSLSFQDDGSMVYRVDDTKSDSSSPVILIDAQGNMKATNIKDANVQCQTAELNAAVSVMVKTQSAEVDADQVNVVSDNITLGKDGTAAPAIRNSDKAEHIDPILGIPIFTDYYVTNSNTTEIK
jgi:hypothetical protein